MFHILKYANLLLLFFFFLSCDPVEDDNKPPPTPECTIDEDFPLEIVWSTLLREDESWKPWIKPAIYENDILFNNNDLGNSTTFYALNQNDGKKNWEWPKFHPNGEWGEIEQMNSTQVFDNKLYFNYGHYKMLMNVLNGHLIWKTLAEDSERELIRLGEYLYYINFIKSDGNIQESQLFRIHKDATEPDWQLVYVLKDGHKLGIPALWINPQGEEILVSKVRAFNPKAIHFVGYNLNKEKIEFLLEDISEYDTEKFPPLVFENKAFLPVSGGFISVDLISEKVLWETNSMEQGFFILSNPILQDGVIVYQSFNGHLRCINGDSGEIKWEKKNTGKSSWNLEYYAGGVYYNARQDSGEFLYGVDIQTGDQFLKAESPYNECYHFNPLRGYLSIDQESGRLYTSDGIWAYCFQLEPQ